MTRSPNQESLTIVIPALDEEEAIGRTLTRCLEAIEPIRRQAGLERVEIIVVSDGSTDRTAEIARSFDGVKLIEFERNRGYGAAIKEGFRQGSGSLVGFLDADGTCDPLFFGPLCRTLIDQRADVVLGSRMGPGSQMPALRRLGNHLFALLLGFLCGRAIADTASGMRVLRRESLERLYPLPDGLHFTPSMSARAILGGLRLIELPMAYHERLGQSKLRVFRDGVRFVRVIVDGVLCYRPERLFLIAFTLCLLVGALLAAYPIEFYLANRRVEEWMIYRFLVCGLLGSVGYQLLAALALAHRMATLGPTSRAPDAFWPALLARLFEGWILLAFVSAVTLVSFLLLWPGLLQYATTGHVTMHWSRLVTGTFGLLLASQGTIAGVLMRVLAIWKTQHRRREADTKTE